MTAFEYTLKDPLGLHMRPAGVMAKQLASLSCSVTVQCGSRSANGKSLLSLMALAAKQGETVTVRVEGKQEEDVLAGLKRFFEENF